MEKCRSNFGDTRIIFIILTGLQVNHSRIRNSCLSRVLHLSSGSMPHKSGTSTHQDVRKDLTSSFLCIQMIEIRHLHEERSTANIQSTEPSGSGIRMDICPFYISNKPSSRYVDVQMAQKLNSYEDDAETQMCSKLRRRMAPPLVFMEISGEVNARSPDQYSPIVGVGKLSSRVQTIRARVNC